jgi:hypothetical protein
VFDDGAAVTSSEFGSAGSRDKFVSRREAGKVLKQEMSKMAFFRNLTNDICSAFPKK